MSLGGLAQFTLKKLRLASPVFGRVHVNVVADATVEIDTLRTRANRRTATVRVHPKQTWRFNNDETVSDETRQEVAAAAAVVMYQRTRLFKPPIRKVAAVRLRARRIARDEINRIRQEIASESDSS